ncbi:hypothetical protein Pelo_19924 [Pelomyxa schiedti]|nr:hypothetical protein Pelo_19924 [Pelomyxa schiedti]
MILERDDAINYWRKLIGPTYVAQARATAPWSLRAKFGCLLPGMNGFHGSDSPQSAASEMQFFQSNFPY